MKSSNEVLISALKTLSKDIYCEYGVATACILEAADRIQELAKEKQELSCKVRELEMQIDTARAAVIRN